MVAAGRHELFEVLRRKLWCERPLRRVKKTGVRLAPMTPLRPKRP